MRTLKAACRRGMLAVCCWSAAEVLAAAPLPAQSPAGLFMYARLDQPFTVGAGTVQHQLMEVSGQVSCDAYGTLSSDSRAVLYVSAGAAATQVQIGLSGGAITSPPFTVPANSTTTVYFEDTGPAWACQLISLAGVVVTAGSGGPVTVEAGSTLTFTAIPTEDATY